MGGEHLPNEDKKLDSLCPESREMERGLWEGQNFQLLKEVQRLEEEGVSGLVLEIWKNTGGVFMTQECRCHSILQQEIYVQFMLLWFNEYLLFL